MQTLDVISINLWQMLASLANLLLLFLMIKKFLYKPVKAMLEARQTAIDDSYSEAEIAKQKALESMHAYDEKLKGAKSEAETIIKDAVATASSREKQIVDDAKAKADGIVRKAEEDAALEIKRSEESVKKQIAEVSTFLTEKVLGREITSADHDKFVNEFIEGIGDDDAAN